MTGRATGTVGRARTVAVWVTVGSLVLGGLAGCESLQRKFRRKPKGPVARPTPIIQFVDYSKAMTPLERYRKHYLMFEYWNAELVAELGDAASSPVGIAPLNTKRIRETSGEALAELETLRGLVGEPVAVGLTELVEGRAQLDRELQRGRFTPARTTLIKRQLDLQTRRLQREFHWRDVEEQLKE